MPHRHHSWRVLCKWAAQTRFMRYTVLCLIALNAVTLGMETNKHIMSEYGNLLILIDHFIIGFFIFEISLRIYGSGAKHFFHDRWNVFDLFVISLSLIPHGSEFSIFRTFRIIRILRIFSAVPSIRRVINGWIASVSSVMAVALMLFIVFYTFSVTATILFHDSSEESFGSLKLTMLTLWPIMTLSEWPDIIHKITTTQDYSWIFFIGFVVITNYTMLNLLAGIIVNTMNKVVHIDEETYQGLDRRKHHVAVPKNRDRRKNIIPNHAPTQAQLSNTEENILAQISELSQQVAELTLLLKERKD